MIGSIYTENVLFDRGPGLDGARGRENMAAFVERDAHRAAIADGLAHFGNLPLVEVHGDTAVATSYIMLLTPDQQGEPRELPNHGTTTGYRVHRVVANRWSLARTSDGWAIASRTVLPMDGNAAATDLLRPRAQPEDATE